MRIVIELKRDAVADVVLNQLWRFTALQSSFAANMIALNGGRPETLTLKDFLTRLRRFPRRSRHPAHQVSARQGARRARICRSASPSPSPISTKSSA